MTALCSMVLPLVSCFTWGCDSSETVGSSLPPPPPPDLPGPPAEPPLPPSLACPDSGYAKRVNVGTVQELTVALRTVQPGTQIVLAPGTYTTPSLTITRSGTAEAPVRLCGPRDAIIAAGNEYAVVLRGASHWRLRGFRISNSFSGLHLERGSNYNVIDSLEVDNTYQEGIAIQGFSSHNTVQWSYVHDTGRRSQYGEGIYIGSDNGHWNWWTPDSRPDNSDSNSVLHTRIERTSAENIDVKEGTTGQLIQFNSFADTGPFAWVALRGSGTQVLDNEGIRGHDAGFQVWTHPSLYPAWGHDNVFRRNRADVQTPGSIGFSIKPGQENDNFVYCDNVVVNAPRGLANVPCIP